MSVPIDQQPARPAMANLIARVRDNISDLAGPSQKFSDVQIQTALDECRQDMRYLELMSGETIQATQDSGGNFHTTLVFLDYYSEWGDWEEDAKLYSYNYQDITSLATPDY